MRNETIRYIIPDIVESSEEVFSRLEEQQLLRRFVSYCPFQELNGRKYEVSELYSTDSKYGGHKLISVNFNNAVAELGYHGEKEDFLLVSRHPEKHKDLYLLIGLMNADKMHKKIDNKTLSSEDFLIIRLVFNDPIFSFFTMNSQIPHCELTDDGELKPHPYFFVTEPRDMNTVNVKLNKYEIKPDYGNIKMGAKG